MQKIDFDMIKEVILFKIWIKVVRYVKDRNGVEEIL